MSAWTDSTVFMDAADGWRVGGLLRSPDGDPGALAPGVLVVPGSRHERDAYGTTPDALQGRGLASLRIDVRGRGASRGAIPYSLMAPRQRRGVVLDVAAALDHLASAPGVDGERLAVVAEQDTAGDALDALAAHAGVRAAVLLSARHGPRTVTAVGRRPLPVLGLVSSEDREGLRGTADAYLAGTEDGSRLEVFRGLGFGATMLAARQFEHPDAEPLESLMAGWLASVLA